jgi:hypothetical protein
MRTHALLLIAVLTGTSEVAAATATPTHVPQASSPAIHTFVAPSKPDARPPELPPKVGHAAAGTPVGRDPLARTVLTSTATQTASTVAIAPLVRPRTMGPTLDPKFLDLSNDAAAKGEWQARLVASGGRPTIMPVGPFDPGKRLLVLTPGLGMDFTDMHPLATQFGQHYQVVVVVTDENTPLTRSAPGVADALRELSEYRRGLRQQARLPPDNSVVAVSHSFGTRIVDAALRTLHERGELGVGDGAFTNVLHVAVAGPWRGQDAPGPIRAALPVLQPAAESVGFLTRKPSVNRVLPTSLRRAMLAPGGAITLVNGFRPTDRVMNNPLGSSVDVKYVAMIEPNGTSSAPHVDALSTLFPNQLRGGELAQVRAFFRDHGDVLARPEVTEDDLAPLVTSGPLGRLGTVHYGLANLVRALHGDIDFQKELPNFVAAARASQSDGDFASRYETILGRIVAKFEGGHTSGMWRNPSFGPYMQKVVDGWFADHEASVEAQAPAR